MVTADADMPRVKIAAPIRATAARELILFLFILVSPLFVKVKDGNHYNINPVTSSGRGTIPRKPLLKTARLIPESR